MDLVSVHVTVAAGTLPSVVVVIAFWARARSHMSSAESSESPRGDIVAGSRSEWMRRRSSTGKEKKGVRRQENSWTCTRRRAERQYEESGEYEEKEQHKEARTWKSTIRCMLPIELDEPRGPGLASRLSRHLPTISKAPCPKTRILTPVSRSDSSDVVVSRAQPCRASVKDGKLKRQPKGLQSGPWVQPRPVGEPHSCWDSMSGRNRCLH